jgi:hypothetical protein
MERFLRSISAPLRIRGRSPSAGEHDVEAGRPPAPCTHNVLSGSEARNQIVRLRRGLFRLNDKRFAFAFALLDHGVGCSEPVFDL